MSFGGSGFMARVEEYSCPPLSQITLPAISSPAVCASYPDLQSEAEGELEEVYELEKEPVSEYDDEQEEEEVIGGWENEPLVMDRPDIPVQGLIPPLTPSTFPAHPPLVPVPQFPTCCSESQEEGRRRQLPLSFRE